MLSLLLTALAWRPNDVCSLPMRDALLEEKVAFEELVSSGSWRPRWSSDGCRRIQSSCVDEESGEGIDRLSTLNELPGCSGTFK